MLSHSTEKRRRVALLCFRNLAVPKTFLREADNTIFSQGVARVPVGSFMSHSTNAFAWEPSNVSKKPGSRKFYAYWGGVAIFHRKLLVSGYRKTLWENPFRFQKSSGFRKNLNKRGASRFSDDIFLSQIPQDFVCEPFVLQKTSGMEKIFEYQGGMPRFLSHSTAKFRGGTLCVAEIFCYGKKIRLSGAYHDFLSTNFCLLCGKTLWGNSSVFQKMSGMEKIMNNRGVATFVRWNFFASQCRKIL